MSTDIVAPQAYHQPDLSTLDRVAPAAGARQAVRSGLWSDPLTWGGQPPASGGIVIPAGVGIMIDGAIAGTFDYVRIEGCLEAARAVNSELRTGLLYVAKGGELWIGSKDAPIAANATARIVFPNRGDIKVAQDPRLLGKGLVTASKTTVVGASKTSKMRAAGAIGAGATALRLAGAPVGWAPGDRLVVTGTRYVNATTVKERGENIKRVENPEDEVVTLVSINGAEAIVTPALRFNHAPPANHPDLTAYVVNYTRNVRFVTEAGETIPVHQRAHAIFMSPQTTVTAAEFNDMGRTDKSIRAVNVASVANVACDTNAQGRYPVHLHRVGIYDNVFPQVENVAVWRSPGWGIAHHSSRANLFDNVTFDTFGAAFMAESGDETGIWANNMAVFGEGQDALEKDGPNTDAFDLGRTGDAFWMQSRLLHLHRNTAAGFHAGNGFVYFQRGADPAIGNQIIDGDDVLQPLSFRYRTNQFTDQPNIQQFTDNEAFAVRRGLTVVKANPAQLSDTRSIIENLTAWEATEGAFLEYTAHYSILNGRFIATARRPNSFGIGFGTNSYDMAIVDSYFEGFNDGAAFFRGTTDGPAAATDQHVYLGVANTFVNIARDHYFNRQPYDVILQVKPPTRSPIVEFGWGDRMPVWDPAHDPSNSRVTRAVKIEGVKVDSVGRSPFPPSRSFASSTRPAAFGEFYFDLGSMTGFVQTDGLHLDLGGGRLAISIPEYVTDQVTGEIALVSFVAEVLGGPCSICGDRSKVRTVPYQPSAAPPRAANDAAATAAGRSVVIPVLGNDTSPDGGLQPSGLTFARNGWVEFLDDGTVRYTPNPGFQGVETFNYWVRSRQGKPAKGQVTVTVGR